MTKFAGKLGMGLAIGLAGAALAGAGVAEAKPRLTGEERLAKILDGRVAGPPVSCISQADRNEVQVIDNTAIVYGSGRTIYVNRPRYPQNLDSHDILVTRLHSSRLCRLDSVRQVDQTSRMFTDAVMLGDFVPYRRVESARR